MRLQRRIAAATWYLSFAALDTLQEFVCGVVLWVTMGKHSKNAGVMGSESLTYHERKALGFGTVQERLGKVGSHNSECEAFAAMVWDVQ